MKLSEEMKSDRDYYIKNGFSELDGDQLQGYIEDVEQLEQQNQEMLEALISIAKEKCRKCTVNYSIICEACENIDEINIIGKATGKKWEDLNE